MPLWNFIHNLSVRGAKTAKIDWGFRGWVATHYTDIWADAVIKGGQNWWAIWPMGGAWACQNLWEHDAEYAAFCEPLVQSHTGEIELLPALPTSWRSGKIDGVRARGGYQLSIEWQDGKLTRFRIDSPFGTVPVIRYEDKLLDPATDSRIMLNLAVKQP